MQHLFGRGRRHGLPLPAPLQRRRQRLLDVRSRPAVARPRGGPQRPAGRAPRARWRRAGARRLGGGGRCSRYHAEGPGGKRGRDRKPPDVERGPLGAVAPHPGGGGIGDRLPGRRVVARRRRADRRDPDPARPESEHARGSDDFGPGGRVRRRAHSGCGRRRRDPRADRLRLGRGRPG